VFAKPRDTRHDWEIYREVALRTMARLDRKPPLRRRLEARARLSVSPALIIAGLLRRGRSGVTMRRLRKDPAGVDLGPLRPGQLPGRLPARSKRVDAAPELVLDDLARLRDASSTEDGELLLIGRRHKQDCNSWMHNTQRLTKGKPRHQLFMHPDDLHARDIDDGAMVAVTSRVGKVEVDVLATDDVMPGVVSLPHGYGHQVGGTRMTNAETVVGVSINDLTDPERLDVSGNAALSGVPVTVSGSGA
jgi:anaerobic selenocysteine-containing dehydrogenase